MKHWARISFFVFLPMLALAFLYLERVTAVGIMTIYGLLSIGRILLQIQTARLESNRQYRVVTGKKVAVIVPVYNEKPEAFAPALKSLTSQSYSGEITVLVLDDGSDNGPIIQSLCDYYKVAYIRLPHGGKREAMYAGFNRVSGDTTVIVTADSDTIWHRDVVKHLVATLYSKPTIGAVTGFIDASNKNTSWLTRIIALRYWMAFNHERASQSYFGCVTCVSGPLGAYRRELIDQIKDQFVNQRFLGKKCTFGDDRYLTNLILGLGYEVRYSKAVAYTEVPATVRQFIKQQTRWGKSHWREMIYQVPALPKQHLYLAYDWTLTLLLPFLLSLALLYSLYLGVTVDASYFLTIIGSILVMSAVRVIEPLRQTRDWYFLLFPLYSLFHLVVLLPLKFYALATINLTHWGTRGSNA